jgi:folate-binding Fe-S cluster repair protein YgfZ
LDVGQHKVGRRTAAGEQGERGCARIGGIDRVTFAHKQHTQELAAHCVVVDDQYA